MKERIEPLYSITCCAHAPEIPIYPSGESVCEGCCTVFTVEDTEQPGNDVYGYDPNGYMPDFF